MPLLRTRRFSGAARSDFSCPYLRCSSGPSDRAPPDRGSFAVPSAVGRRRGARKLRPCPGTAVRRVALPAEPAGIDAADNDALARQWRQRFSRRRGGSAGRRTAQFTRVPVQIAHLSGAGGYDDPSIEEALCVFIDAIAKHDQRMEHVYFEIAGIAGIGQWQEKGELIATRIRKLGLDRVLYGSDGAISGNTPREYWARFRQLPLSDAEFRESKAISPPI